MTYNTWQMNTSVELLAKSIDALLELLRDPAWNGVAALVAIVLALQNLLRRLLALLARKLREISLGEANELLSEVLDSATLPYEHAELVPQPDHSAELEELREVARSVTPQIVDSFAPLRNIIKDSLKVPVPRLQYVPYSVRYKPLSVSYQPMRMRYRPMKIRFENGLPQIVPAGVDYEPPRFKVMPPSLELVPGGFRLVQG